LRRGDEMHCRQCDGTDLIKRGRKAGHQRYMCRACGRYCTDSQPKFTAQTKTMAIEMYMNGMGIRAIGRVLAASPAAVQQRLANQGRVQVDEPDIIEMDEIYTYVQKNDAGQ
jgi:transposase-like protein